MGSSPAAREGPAERADGPCRWGGPRRRGVAGRGQRGALGLTGEGAQSRAWRGGGAQIDDCHCTKRLDSWGTGEGVWVRLGGQREAPSCCPSCPAPHLRVERVVIICVIILVTGVRCGEWQRSGTGEPSGGCPPQRGPRVCPAPCPQAPALGAPDLGGKRTQARGRLQRAAARAAAASSEKSVRNSCPSRVSSHTPRSAAP